MGWEVLANNWLYPANRVNGEDLIQAIRKESSGLLSLLENLKSDILEGNEGHRLGRKIPGHISLMEDMLRQLLELTEWTKFSPVKCDGTLISIPLLTAKLKGFETA